jgi:hypothetical protein
MTPALLVEVENEARTVGLTELEVGLIEFHLLELMTGAGVHPPIIEPDSKDVLVGTVLPGRVIVLLGPCSLKRRRRLVFWFAREKTQPE